MNAAFASYRIEHDTRYDYGAPVSASWQLARLTPRALPWQHTLWHTLVPDPTPDECTTGLDACGNAVTRFALHRRHTHLEVRMACQVEVAPRPAWAPAVPEPWEAVREASMRGGLDAALMRETTPGLPWSQAARDYAAASLHPGRDWLEAVLELMQRIHREFEFVPGATTVSTPVDAVLAERKGVCQDFAQLMITCLRTHGLPARYMSGYLLTHPPEGQPRLVGADATHAWVAAHSPQHGWVELDPTNGCLADTRYVTLAWGRDFAEAGPLRGVILGGGEQRLEVKVSVWPLDSGGR
ncbi:transglutaminase family protein [Caldimonas thermodepolymerans]|jgi:Transglutaminase-like enzymes, putative cysteine proteases|uniref:Transglutaminase n=1 Tax=Caldimonas thermodepolymerans TaxID=215580 RepID=A0A2S5T469_9BURK|nr:transglutaminase family protein [Caldimonas thermodepolymerans]PPE69746.1 transglutaminase [Caldimonas thermodepolymerans]QPC32581.1 transglutaminase family protein [Caldimonas thermodepolymerans]RDI03326.1 transglutaminase-like putative cysteine protease [Caldimonas thermodepolymerans]TCP06815.1 transglutaminase-like putative cysteine protease [Caldimonas thermodepolymerans]UZG45385.1 transglutaminase family protein [Caldimonas thermodepolymerans]